MWNSAKKPVKPAAKNSACHILVRRWGGHAGREVIRPGDVLDQLSQLSRERTVESLALINFGNDLMLNLQDCEYSSVGKI
jgi:hypothetical protein